MRIKAVAMTIGAALVAVATLSAQAKSDFSGKWTLVPDANAAAAGGGGGRGGGGRMGGGGAFGFSCGMECTITQDATSLKLERAGAQGATTTMSVKLDGSDSKNSVTMGANPMDVTLKGKWDGAKLVVTSAVDMNGTAISSDTTFSMDGANLVIESKRPGRNGGEATVTKQTYKKS